MNIRTNVIEYDKVKHVSEEDIGKYVLYNPIGITLAVAETPEKCIDICKGGNETITMKIAQGALKLDYVANNFIANHGTGTIKITEDMGQNPVVVCRESLTQSAEERFFGSPVCVEMYGDKTPVINWRDADIFFCLKCGKYIEVTTSGLNVSLGWIIEYPGSRVDAGCCDRCSK